MSDPVAYLLTWTTYGTWLHGDERGSVNRCRNVYGEEYLPVQPLLRDHERRAVRAGSFVLDSAARAAVAAAITRHAALRGWELLALNVRTNHVHAVVGHAPVGPERMLNEFKAYVTRVLRAAKLATADERVWTRHGSTRYLWEEKSIAPAVAYVQDGQDGPR